MGLAKGRISASLVKSSADRSTYNEAETPIRTIPSFAEFGHLHDATVPGSPSPVLAPVRTTRSPSPFKLEKDALHMRLKRKAVVNGNGYAGNGNGTLSTPVILEEKEKEEAEERKGSRGRRRPLQHYDAEGRSLRYFWGARLETR